MERQPYESLFGSFLSSFYKIKNLKDRTVGLSYSVLFFLGFGLFFKVQEYNAKYKYSSHHGESTEIVRER